MSKRKFDLEDRLIDFAVIVDRMTDSMPKIFSALNLSKQICRSSSSVALNYGEVLGAESDKDFLHKMKICLKELRETQNCLKIIQRRPHLTEKKVQPILQECSELVAIFVTSIETKKRNMHTR